MKQYFTSRNNNKVTENKKSDLKEKSALQGPIWVYVLIWIILLIIMWIVYGFFAPNLALLFIALVITVGGPALYYGIQWYKTSK